MALLACLLLVESACLTTLLCSRSWFFAAVVALLILGQLYATTLHFERAQSMKRYAFAMEKLNHGFSFNDARNAAYLQHPNLRTLIRMATEQLRSLFGRKG